MFEDIIFNLDDKLELFESYERACRKIKRIEKRLIVKLNRQLKEAGMEEINLEPEPETLPEIQEGIYFPLLSLIH